MYPWEQNAAEFLTNAPIDPNTGITAVPSGLATKQGYINDWLWNNNPEWKAAVLSIAPSPQIAAAWAKSSTPPELGLIGQKAGAVPLGGPNYEGLKNPGLTFTLPPELGGGTVTPKGNIIFSKDDPDFMDTAMKYVAPIAGMLTGNPALAAAGGAIGGAASGDLSNVLKGALLAGGASYAAPYLKGLLPDVSGSMPSWLTDAASSVGDLFSGAPGATEGATTYPYVDPGAVAGTALDAGRAGLADYSLASGADGLGLTAGGGLGLTAESLPFAGTGGLGLTAPALGGGTITAGGLGIPLTAGAAGALGTGGAASGMTVPGSGASATSAGGAAGTTGAAGTVGMGSGFKIPGTDITVPWSLAGTALGALAGGLGGASEAGTTTSITDLPPWQKNLVIPGMQDAARIYGTLPEGVDPSMTMGRDYLMSTIGGNYLQNPYEQAVADALGADASKAVAGQFELGGRYGSPGMAEATARGVVNAIAPYRYNTYAQERARQQQAALAAPDYSGAFITQPLLKSKAYMDIIGRPFGSSKTEPYFENRTASIIGGGLLGSRLFS